jgi:RNA polymerase sigma-70 factor (ECF subfamily)
VTAPARTREAARLPGHLDRLFRAALALSGSGHDAEVLVQETYARVLRRPHFPRHEDDRARWMRALRNAWIDSHAPCSTPEPGAAFAALAGLSPRLRETIVAVDVMGLSHKEAARALRVRRGTLTSRLFRARELVAAAMDATAS